MVRQDNGGAEQNKIVQSSNEVIEGVVFQPTNDVGCSFVENKGMLGLLFTRPIDAFLLPPSEALAFARVLRDRALAIVD